MLIVLSLALAVIILDTTILNVALGSIIRDLHTDIQSIQWVITAYSLTLAGLTITGGRLGDLFGRKKMFVVGAVMFAIGSFIASISQNVGTLIAGESIIEGIGAALMMPATSSLLISNFEGRARAIAFGVWGGIAGASAALGPIIGGYLATNYSWRWGFRVNLIVVLLLVIGSVLIPDSRDTKEKKELDILGVVLSSTGLLSFVFGIIESTTYGWWKAKLVFSHFGYSFIMPNDLSIVPAFMGLGVILLGLFLLWEWIRERSGHTPLVSISIFANRAFSSGLVMTGIMSLGQAGLIFALPVFLQSVRGLDAYHTGLALLPMSIVILVTAPLSAVLSKYILPKYLVNFGLFLNVMAYVVLWNTLSVHSTASDLAPGLVLFGMGMGFVMSQINNITLSAVPIHQAGEASGINATLRQVGSTLGSAIIGAILIGTLGSQMTAGVEKSKIIPESYKPKLEQILSTQTSNIEFGGGAQVGAGLPESISIEIIDIGHQATVDSARSTFEVGGLFALLGFIASLIFLPGKKKTVEEKVVEVAEVVEVVEAPPIVTMPEPEQVNESVVLLTTEMLSELIEVDATLVRRGQPSLGAQVRQIIESNK